jgi:hypothetical protein
MAARSEGLICEATDVEGAPTSAAHQRTEKRSAAPDDLPSQEVLRRAQALLMQVLSILNDPSCECPSRAVWSFKLARAHALTLFDHLERIAESVEVSAAETTMSDAGTRAVVGDADAASAVRKRDRSR